MLASIGEESQVKLQETMQKIVNDSNGGWYVLSSELFCIEKRMKSFFRGFMFC